MANKQEYLMEKINIMQTLKNKKGAGFTPFILGLVIVIFFVFCMMGFVINFMESQNPDSPLLDDTYLLSQSYGNMSSSFSDFGEIADATKTELREADPSPSTYVFLMFRGAFFIPMSVLGFVVNGVISMQNILYNSIAQSMGGQFTLIGRVISSALTLLFAGLIFTIVFLIIKNIRTGESER